jgi:alkylation response protein AidB-like acyl-CoA dehydrogenase
LDLSFSPAEEALRAEVRAFIAAELPPALRQKAQAGEAASKEEITHWQRALNRAGYAVPHWPVEFGGRDFTVVQRYILREELDLAPAPTLVGLGINLVAPVIIAFGTRAQKQRFLPPIANTDEWWAQGFSEPGAGSDLASLRTTARRDGAHYVVNGEKTWTTYGHYADWMFCLVRTDPQAPKQAGISFLLIDMKSPGVTVRPIRLIDGAPPGRHEVNQVFFDDVRVPVDNLVGRENDGWTCAKFLLANERTGSARVGIAKERLCNLKRLASVDGPRPALADPLFFARVTALEVELKAHEITTLRVLSEEARRGTNAPNPLSSLLKMRGTEIQQKVSELYLDLAGPDAMRVPSFELDEAAAARDALWRAGATYFNWRKLSIFGGSNEIQRNILARSVLGL